MKERVRATGADLTGLVETVEYPLEHVEVLKEEVGKLGEHFLEPESLVSSHAETVDMFAVHLARLEDGHSTGGVEEISGDSKQKVS